MSYIDNVYLHSVCVLRKVKPLKYNTDIIVFSVFVGELLRMKSI